MPVSRDYYFKLASEVAEERIEAAIQLINELSTVDDTEEYDYALNRLVKGLNTSRQSARYGFSMALTELIPQLVAQSRLSIESYLEMVHKIIELKSKKGKDERSALFGKLFALQALVNSKIVYDEESKWNVIIDEFLQLAMVKSWLRETVIFSMLQFVKELPKKSVYDHIITKINDLGLSTTNEGLAIYLTMDLANVSGPQIAQWKGFPLSKGNGVLLAKVLKEVEIDTELKQKGSWSPRLHFVWDLLVAWFSKPEESAPKSKKRKPNSEMLGLKEFWKSIIDDGFFGVKASHERKYLGLEILEKFFSQLPYTNIPHIITHNLVRCIINQASQSDRTLNKQSLKVLASIKNECIKNPIKVPYTLKAFLTNGGWNFDSLSRTKTVESLLVLSHEGVHTVENVRDVLVEHFNSFVEPLNDEEASKKIQQNNLQWSMNGFVNLIRNNRSLVDEKEWIRPILQLLLKYSLFETPASKYRGFFREKLNSILGEIIGHRDGQHSWSMYCIKYIHVLEKHHELIESFDEELNGIKTECEDMLTQITNLPFSDKRFNFELLVSMVLLQIYNGDEDSFQLVDELKVCFTKVFEEEENSSMILTEIVLSFISKKSGLLRKFSMIIWENLLCKGDLDEECLELLYNVLVTRENKEGQSSLFEGDDEMVDVEEEGEEKEEPEEAEEKDQEPESEASDDSDDSESDSEDENPINKQTNIKLALALGIPTENDGEVKFEDLSDEGDSSYESESMDDEQMMAMDDQLSKIFKERRDILSSAESGNKRKADTIEAREQMIFFKNRILDLLEIYTKTNEHSYLNFSMVKPMLTLINLTLDKTLGTKAHKFVKAKLSKVKLDPEHSDKVPQLLELIEWIHTYNNDTKSNNSFNLACNQLSLLVAKNIVLLDPQLIDWIIDIYSESMKRWVKEKSNIQPGLFFDFVNWLNSRR